MELTNLHSEFDFSAPGKHKTQAGRHFSQYYLNLNSREQTKLNKTPSDALQHEHRQHNAMKNIQGNTQGSLHKHKSKRAQTTKRKQTEQTEIRNFIIWEVLRTHTGKRKQRKPTHENKNERAQTPKRKENTNGNSPTPPESTRDPRSGEGRGPHGGGPWEPKGIPWEGTRGRGTLGSPRDPTGGVLDPLWEGNPGSPMDTMGRDC
jgi:hypothetical protein